MDFIILEEKTNIDRMCAINTKYLKSISVHKGAIPTAKAYIEISTEYEKFYYGYYSSYEEAVRKYNSLALHLKNGNAYVLGGISGWPSNNIDFIRNGDNGILVPTDRVDCIYVRKLPQDPPISFLPAKMRYSLGIGEHEVDGCGKLFETEEEAEAEFREVVSAFIEGRMFEKELHWNSSYEGERPTYG